MTSSSTTWADHLGHIRAVLVSVKLSKCAFGVNSIQYLGHIISADCVAMGPAKVQVVRD